MTKIDEKQWTMRSHTKAKHDVLREYTGLWYTILGQSAHQKLVFIDGFAGRGEYIKGEEGSPVIAINAIADARKKLSEKLSPPRLAALSDVTFLFIEKDETLAAHLRAKALPPLMGKLREGDSPSVTTGTFGEEMTDILNSIAGTGRRLAPAFVMIDPFGYSGYPLSLVARILFNRSSEVYITFMGSFINRFATENPKLITETFGTAEWKDLLDVDEDSSVKPESRARLVALYEKQLRAVGAKHVLRFDVYRTARDYIYSLFFATNNLKGCSAMKEAMWKTAPGGDFRFIGKNANQFSMSDKMVDYSQLTDDLIAEFGCNNWVSIEDAEAFMASDRTGFLMSHLRDKSLIPKEREQSLDVYRPGGVRKSAFPPNKGVRFRFLDEPLQSSLI